MPDLSRALVSASRWAAISCGQTIGPPPAFAHVGIIERLDLTDFPQPHLPTLHPWMRRWRPCAGREKEKRLWHLVSLGGQKQTIHRLRKFPQINFSKHPPTCAFPICVNLRNLWTKFLCRRCRHQFRPIELSEIRAARERIASTIVRTPLVRLELGSDFPDIRLKLENLQPINAYKLRGAANAVAMLSESDRAARRLDNQRRQCRAGRGLCGAAGRRAMQRGRDRDGAGCEGRANACARGEIDSGPVRSCVACPRRSFLSRGGRHVHPSV